MIQNNPQNSIHSLTMRNDAQTSRLLRVKHAVLVALAACVVVAMSCCVASYSTARHSDFSSASYSTVSSQKPILQSNHNAIATSVRSYGTARYIISAIRNARSRLYDDRSMYFEGMPLQDYVSRYGLSKAAYVNNIQYDSENEDDAYRRAQETAQHGQFGHFGPDGVSAPNYAGRKAWGEDLAWGTDLAGSVQMWIPDEEASLRAAGGRFTEDNGHLYQILNPRNLSFGYGEASGGPYGIVSALTLSLYNGDTDFPDGKVSGDSTAPQHTFSQDEETQEKGNRSKNRDSHAKDAAKKSDGKKSDNKKSDSKQKKQGKEDSKKESKADRNAHDRIAVGKHRALHVSGKVVDAAKQSQNNGSAATLVWTVLVVIVLCAAIGYGAWFYLRKRTAVAASADSESSADSEFSETSVSSESAESSATK